MPIRNAQVPSDRHCGWSLEVLHEKSEMRNGRGISRLRIGQPFNRDSSCTATETPDSHSLPGANIEKPTRDTYPLEMLATRQETKGEAPGDRAGHPPAAFGAGAGFISFPSLSAMIRLWGLQPFECQPSKP